MKAQIFSMDMVLSFFVFTGLTVFSIYLIDYTADSGMLFHEEDIMEEQAVRTSDFLVSTPGYPENWTFSDVEVTGIADSPNLVKSSRFLELKRMDYEQFKSLNRITRYDFNLEIISEKIDAVQGVCGGKIAVIASETSVFIDLVEGTGFEWDLYWSGQENVYTGFENVFEGSEEEVFESFLSNREDYDCAVSIKPSVHRENVSNHEELAEFAEKNVYVQMGEGEIISVIEGVESFEEVSGSGTVVDGSNNIINKHLSEGDELEFESFSKGFEDAENVYVEDEGLCVVCSWSSNTFFFTGDTVEETSVQQLNLEGSQVSDLYFFGSDTSFGVEPENPETLVPVRRQVVMRDGGELKEAVFEMVVWK